MVEGGTFAIVADATEDELELLATALRAATGADVHVLDGFVAPESPRFRLSTGRRFFPKLALTVALGGAAHLLTTPLVSAAAVVMALVLVVRAGQLVPREVEVGRTRAAERLGTFDRTLLSEIRATSSLLTSDAGGEARETA
jgi:hypothetical protein